MKIDRFFIHRVNTIKELNCVNISDGCEIDLRTMGEELILNHDPFCEGEPFKNWLSEYRHNGIILNNKEEGLEKKIVEILTQYNVKEFFFLDLSIPFLYTTSNNITKNIAARFSEFEPYQFCKKFIGLCKWVWIDSFTGKYFTLNEILELKKNFKVCLMSPELRGFPKSDIQELKHRYKGVGFDAVCTKHKEEWVQI